MGFNGNDNDSDSRIGNDRGRPLPFNPIAPALHCSNTPTRCYDNTPAPRPRENLTQNLRIWLL